MCCSVIVLFVPPLVVDCLLFLCFVVVVIVGCVPYRFLVLLLVFVCVGCLVDVCVLLLRFVLLVA